MGFTVTIVDPNDIRVNRDGISTFTGLTDTAFSGLAAGDIAEFNGTAWANIATYINSAIANTYTDGKRQTFNPDNITAGFNFGSNAIEPSSPLVGDTFYDTTVGQFKGYDGAWINLGAGAGGGDAWGDPVDANIIPDADGTRDLGNTGTRFDETFTDNLDVTNNIVVGGTVDGRTLSTDGSKLDGIETGATADQSDSEIKTAYENNSNTNAFTDAEQTKLGGIEALADVTDTANVDAAGAVMETDYNANTILAANANDTPLALTIAEQTLVGRITSGNIIGLTVTQIRTLINVEDGSTADQTEEEIQDFAWNVLGGTQTLITVTYQDITNDVDFEVDNNLANYSNASAGFLINSNNLSDVSSAPTARGNLGLAIGSDVQAFDADLSAIAALATTDSNFIVGNGSTWVVESGETARTSLGAQEDLSGATITAATVATGDKILGQDLDDSDNLKTYTAQSIANLKVTELSEDATPVLSGPLDANGNNITDVHEIRLDASPDTDHTANGPTTNTINAGVTTAVGELVYLATDGEWALADADAESTSTSMLAISMAVGSDGNPLLVALAGSFVRDDTFAFTIGDVLYVDTTAGGITATAPSATGDIVRVIGYAVTADIVYFLPSGSWVEIV